jgi:hypothetical protein
MNDRAYLTKIDFLGADLLDEASDWVAVRDERTGLTWAKEPTAVDDWMPETEARIASEFKASRLAGLDGWRIPTLEEQVSILHTGRPSINADFFPNCPSDWFWTSTVYAPSPGDCAWVVLFSNGDAYWYNRDFNGFVRAVRASQSSAIGSPA